jgi:hypothetical protein
LQLWQTLITESGDDDSSDAGFMNNFDKFNPQVIDFNFFEKCMAKLFKIHKVPDEM